MVASIEVANGIMWLCDVCEPCSSIKIGNLAHLAPEVLHAPDDGIVDIAGQPSFEAGVTLFELVT